MVVTWWIMAFCAVQHGVKYSHHYCKIKFQTARETLWSYARFWEKVLPYLWFKYDFGRSATHPKFDLTTVWIHDLQTMDSTFHVPEALTLATEPPGSSSAMICKVVLFSVMNCILLLEDYTKVLHVLQESSMYHICNDMNKVLQSHIHNCCFTHTIVDNESQPIIITLDVRSFLYLTCNNKNIIVIGALGLW